MGMSGAQYIHYAFGLLDRTNTFCPIQAVLDNEQIGKIKHCLREPKVDQAELDDMLRIVKKVMASSHRLYARFARKAMHRGDISNPYRFEAKGLEDKVIENALDHMAKLEAEPAEHLDKEIQERIFAEVPGILPSLKAY
jgi:trimethylamine--corrinoid protein Co-methyltransferase